MWYNLIYSQFPFSPPHKIEILIRKIEILIRKIEILIRNLFSK